MSTRQSKDVGQSSKRLIGWFILKFLYIHNIWNLSTLSYSLIVETDRTTWRRGYIMIHDIRNMWWGWIWDSYGGLNANRMFLFSHPSYQPIYMYLHYLIGARFSLRRKKRLEDLFCLVKETIIMFNYLLLILLLLLKTFINHFLIIFCRSGLTFVLARETQRFMFTTP